MQFSVKRSSLIPIILMQGVVLPGCSSNKGTNSTQGIQNPNAKDIDSYIAGLPDYSLAPPVERAPKQKNPVYVVHNDAGWLLDYRFDVEDRNIVMMTDDIMSPDRNFGVLWPGNVVQGKSVPSGDLKQLLLDRAPVTLTISLDAPVTSIVVDNPNSVTAQQAVADLKRSVDPSLVGDKAPSSPGTVSFVVDAANSFQQSMLSMKITGGYSQPMSAEIGGSANMSVTRAYSEQTIVARLVQKLFTIRIADDLPSLRTPSGFFASHVTMAELQAQETAGNIGPDNLPMYIESVTYGRIIVFTLKSTSAKSVEELAAAVNAKYEGYKGGAGATAEQEEILSTRTTQVYQAGGNASAAQAAVSSLDFSQFFTDMEATEAVPLSFKLKELKYGANGDFVNIYDSTSFDTRDNGKRPRGYEVTVALDKIVHTDGFCVDCPIAGKVIANYNGLPEHALGSHIFHGSPPQTYVFGSGAVEVLSYNEPERTAIIFPYFAPMSERGSGVKTPGYEYEYPFNEIVRGVTYTDKLIDNGVTIDYELYFKISKTPVY